MDGACGATITGRFRRRPVTSLATAALLAVIPLTQGCGNDRTDDPDTSGGSVNPADPVATTVRALLATDVDVNLDGNEPHMAVNPLNPNVVAVSLCFAVSMSFDGGRTFDPADQIPFSQPAGYGGGCDDVLAFDTQGRLFVAFLGVIQCQNPASPLCNGGFRAPELFVQRLDPREGIPVASRRLDTLGNDCSGGTANQAECPVNVTKPLGLGACDDVNVNGRGADRHWFAADTRPPCGTPTPARATRTCSPFSDNLYLIWSDGACGTGAPSAMQVASSSNQGANWTNLALTIGAAPGFDLRNANIGFGANGDVYAAYHIQGFAGEPNGVSGQIVTFQSQDGTAADFANHPATFPFPAPLADITLNQQQCLCPGSVCASQPTIGCTFSSTRCPGGPQCECAANDCTPAASCPNTPITGYQACSRRLQTNGNLTFGSQSMYVVGDPTNPNNIAMFASTDPNRSGTARDNFDVNYVVASNAAAGTPIWTSPIAVTPNNMALPGTNQLFPTAAQTLDNTCVTVMYFDDRNPATNAFGNNLLDVFVTVNPNLWSAGVWQTEKQINHTAFNGDSFGIGNDFFPYCTTAGCVTPAGWRPTSRMGEYNGLLMAGGVAWVGNNGNAQQILFNFSDAIAPVVTAPPPVSIGTCQPMQAALGSGAATDECGKPPLSAVTSDLASKLPLIIGSNTITWSATDGADNTGSATQTVTVQDNTGPSFTIIPPDVTTTSCTGVNIGQAFAQDDCAGTVTITNNAPSQFPLGTTIVTWTARDARGNTRTATQRVTALLGDNPSCCPAGTNVILGNSNNNVLNGTIGSDCILGRGAQDTINGNGGNDFISGGDGDDNINGGAGNDAIYGGSGQDTITGGTGNDNLFGGDGDDDLFGGDGNDTLHGGQGQDDLRGENNDDLIFGDTGDDSLNGGAGNDTLAGGPNNDTCTGDGGTNVFESCEFGGVANACGDGIQNGTQTGVDCGGGCPGCPTGGGCVSGNDCLGGVCSAGVCQSVPGGIRVAPVVTTDWGGGYCVELQTTNASIVATTTWSATVNTNQSTIYTSWNASFSGTSGVVTVSPSFLSNQVVDPGETDASIGFCANRNVPGSGLLPFVTSASGVFP